MQDVKAVSGNTVRTYCSAQLVCRGVKKHECECQALALGSCPEQAYACQ